MRYELKDLRLFLAIVEAQNLSVGAESMHMTASSASYRLKNLEYVVGSAVFLRTSKGMRLTAAGEVLARHARTVLADVERMHLELGDFSRNFRGSIRVLANSSSLNSFILPSLARFLASNSSIDIDLKEKDSPSISRAIEEGVADIGVGADLEPLPGLSRELYAVDRLVCVVHPEHPLAGQDSLTLDDVLRHDLVSLDPGSSNFLFLSHRARLAGMPMKVRVHVHDFNAVLYMVEAGVGAAVVPASVAGKAVRDGRLAMLSLADPWAARNLYLVMKDDDSAGLVREFSQILLQDPLVAAARAAG